MNLDEGGALGGWDKLTTWDGGGKKNVCPCSSVVSGDNVVG